MFEIEQWLPFLLAKSHQITFSLMKAAMEEFGLTPPQFATLAFLWQGDKTNQHDLGALMCVDRTTISGIVDRLDKLALISREEDPADRRSYVLCVTDKGSALRDRVIKALESVQNVIDEKLTRDEQAQLRELLGKLRSRT